MSDDRVEIAPSQRQEVAVDLDPVARGAVDGRSGQRSSAGSDRWQRRQALQRAERVGDQPITADLVARKPLTVEEEDSMSGTAQVREVFRSSKFGVVAGCLVTEGVVKRNNPIRVLRESVVIFEGALESLRRFKDDAGEVRAGTECGIGVKNYQDVRVGDQIECYSRVEVARSIQ